MPAMLQTVERFGYRPGWGRPRMADVEEAIGLIERLAAEAPRPAERREVPTRPGQPSHLPA